MTAKLLSSLDDAVDWNLPGPPCFVELSIPRIDQRAAIVTYDRVSRRRLRALPSFQNLVYCSPLGSAPRLPFDLLSTENASPSFLFASPGDLHFGCCFSRISFCTALCGSRFLFRDSVLPASQSVLQAAPYIRIHWHGLLCKFCLPVHAQGIAEFVLWKFSGQRSLVSPQSRSQPSQCS